MKQFPLQHYLQIIRQSSRFVHYGRVKQVIGLTIEAHGPAAKMGDVCWIYPANHNVPCMAEVVGFRDDRVLLMPLGDLGAIAPGSEVRGTGRALHVTVGAQLLGRILNGLGEPIDELGPLASSDERPTENEPPNPLARPVIRSPLSVGVRCIDSLLSVGRGQRIGIFAGSGVGKSTLLGMIARNTSADVNVIALIGERGREVREFIEKDLGPEGLARSVLVVATSDQPALVRIKGASVATAIAEYFRDQGLHVNLMMDSITRFAMAKREVGLAVGEPPATKGYPPSVFAVLPKLLERAGTSSKGTITGFYTVLVDADDLNDPVADAVRGILDGHVVLSRELANKGHFPSIDVLSSVSRVMNDLVSPDHRKAAANFKKLAAAYREAEDLIHIGAYRTGSNPIIDKSIQYRALMDQFLVQTVDEKADYETAVESLIELFGGMEL
ncbi:flagellar protein export ATPase FliI [Effusibacillus dendaii]|uniref:EscN/YscN/HrcN family type III secretion system ATPase n=1 Tax=Effusibacillus dendaii TaxID=2743772 RepID=A0A7I8DBF8_9BACL|nr:flagellar protein export ATPase FliI [Effusibacillus dendaii]BCJ85261.1 EscN/YscN/HrcN family type III secretion system ATPase [Effusibacillus dendaii]